MNGAPYGWLDSGASTGNSFEGGGNPSKGIAVGHVMRKLLHLVFAIWKTGKPFDPQHYPWATPVHVEQESGVRNQESD